MAISTYNLYLFPADTAANWTAANPILLKGELALESDTNKYKFGDGVTAWTTLAYAGGTGTTTFLDTAFRVQDNVDATKQLAFEASGITTATTRTLTVPDANGTMVLDTATQTLTNKSIVTTQLTGVLAAAQEPAHTGDVTNTAGSLALTIAAGAVTPAKMSNGAANSFRGNNTGVAATLIDMTVAQAKALLAISLTSDVSGVLQAAQFPAMTGDVTNTAGSLATTIAAGAVSLSKMANLTASTILGNNTGIAATPLALTGTQVTAMLDNFSSTLKGLAPLSGGGTANFLRADGTWTTPPGTGGSTFLDGVFRVQNTADATKQIALDASGITTATTRTYTAPNLSGTLTLLELAQTWTAAQGFGGMGHTLGAGTGAGTVNIATGSALSGNTKTVNIASFGASGSTSDVNIGSANAGALGTLTINTPTVAFGATTTAFNIKDSVFTLQDDGDATKKAQFQLSGITTATTRTFTLPDASGTVALLASPTFTGVPAAPTAAPGTNTTQLANTAFVTAAIAAAPGGVTFGKILATAQGAFTI